MDLSGKKFVDIARQILGFNIVVLFFSHNKNHFQWLQQYPNALYTDNQTFLKEYINNYNMQGLLNLRNKIQNIYHINLPFLNDFLSFPKFVNKYYKYKDISFEIKTLYFKKVVIYHKNSDSILYMDEKRNVFFEPRTSLKSLNKYIWYVTMINNQITLYSKGSYLSADINKKMAIGVDFMDNYYYYEKIIDEYYYIYYNNKNQTNALTKYGNYAILNPIKNSNDQIFKFIEPDYNLK